MKRLAVWRDGRVGLSGVKCSRRRFRINFHASAIAARAPRACGCHAAMVFATILKYLPMGDNMKVAFGTSVVLAISYATLARKGTSYDNMAEKREAMKNQELADREAARAARAAG